MLFNSYLFIFLYLPVALAGFFQPGRINHAYASAWLAFASLFFYGYSRDTTQLAQKQFLMQPV